MRQPGTSFAVPRLLTLDEPEHDELEQNDDREESQNYNPLHGFLPLRAGG